MTKTFHYPTSYKIKQVPIHSIEVWEDAQARELDMDGIRELAESIQSEGLQNPPLVQKNGRDSYLLLSGQRRLAAFKKLNAQTIPVLVLDEKIDLEDARASSIIENLHRKDMSSKEMAEACSFLSEKIGKTKAAKMIGVSKRTFKSYHGFAGVPYQLKDLVPNTISRENATRLYNIVPSINEAVEIAHKISKLTAPNKRRYLNALEEDPRADHSQVKRRANQFRVQENLHLTLSRTRASGLAKESSYHEMEPGELAKKVLSDWLKRRGY